MTDAPLAGPPDFDGFSRMRTIHLVERKRLVSHAEAEQTLRRGGYSEERIEDVLRDIPDPIDAERDGEALFKRGVSAGILMDQMGASP